MANRASSMLLTGQCAIRRLTSVYEYFGLPYACDAGCSVLDCPGAHICRGRWKHLNFSESAASAPQVMWQKPTDQLRPFRNNFESSTEQL